MTAKLREEEEEEEEVVLAMGKIMAREDETRREDVHVREKIDLRELRVAIELVVIKAIVAPSSPRPPQTIRDKHTNIEISILDLNIRMDSMYRKLNTLISLVESIKGQSKLVQCSPSCSPILEAKPTSPIKSTHSLPANPSHHVTTHASPLLTSPLIAILPPKSPKSSPQSSSSTSTSSSSSFDSITAISKSKVTIAKLSYLKSRKFSHPS